MHFLEYFHLTWQWKSKRQKIFHLLYYSPNICNQDWVHARKEPGTQAVPWIWVAVTQQHEPSSNTWFKLGNFIKICFPWAKLQHYWQSKTLNVLTSSLRTSIKTSTFQVCACAPSLLSFPSLQIPLPGAEILCRSKQWIKQVQLLSLFNSEKTTIN